ncbi:MULTISPECIES: DUF2642 domain-containing protein [Paenibacillus]|uniref:DUF2642 domain-containing protein n=1 Tax=Paenibacillus TaxID=44249 RepID=UPI00203FCCC5|nr:DUF2642 domain-containing protein [Paenibacillus camelliae]MCM3634924.1 DUF2642 domain-containing protein [Paenibacillus camelliae]
MSMIHSLLNKVVNIEISGEKRHTGILIDYGRDMLVVYNGMNFIYFPTHHIQNIRANDKPEEEITSPSDTQYESEPNLSYRKVLLNARGQFLEVYISGQLSLHGYVTAIMNNYFVFYSPVYKTIYIPMYHLKWLIPYPTEQTPFSIDRERLPVSPSIVPLARTFEEQLDKLIGEIIVFDLGVNPNKIGLLSSIEDHYVELVIGKGERFILNMHHIKSVHSPKQL